MEDWQRKHVVRNLSKLVKLTDCNITLLTALRSENILNDEDIQIIQNGKTREEKSYHLFVILQTRTESYQALIAALFSTLQSGAANILVAGFISHGTIKFQGASSLISDLLPNLNEELKQELISLQMKQPRIDQVVVKNTIPCKLGYYIPRTIISHRKLNPSLFQEKCSDVFFFQGLEWSELSCLANGLSTDVSTDILDLPDQFSTRFNLLESSEHFDMIVDKTKEPVHLIEHTNGVFQWIKSHGSVEIILKFVEATPDLMKEESFIKNILNDKISVCLTDSPGMGKTVLLASLARATRDQYPNRLAMFIHLRELLPVVEKTLNNGKPLDSRVVLTVLSEHVSDNPVGRRIVSHKLLNHWNHVFFDGFDEVIPELRELTTAMLKVIANTFHKCQVFVTARLHMQEEMEQSMGTLGFHIAPFNIDNKIQFLTKFWEFNGAESIHLTEYAVTCLKTLTAEIIEGERDIAGIPLQCLMIGEVFLNKAKCFRPGVVLGVAVPIKSMAQLYSMLFRTKLYTIKVRSTRELIKKAHIHSV